MTINNTISEVKLYNKYVHFFQSGQITTVATNYILLYCDEYKYIIAMYISIENCFEQI